MLFPDILIILFLPPCLSPSTCRFHPNWVNTQEKGRLALEIGELGSSFPNNTKKKEYFQPLSIIALSLFVLSKIAVSYIR